MARKQRHVTIYRAHAGDDASGAPAQAVDLDGDGDLDIVACALVSSEDVETRSLPAVVWLEQMRPGVFERHVLEAGLPTHATLDVGDFDNDGDMDIWSGTSHSTHRCRGWLRSSRVFACGNSVSADAV